MTFYWIVLPFALLLTGGWISTLLFSRAPQNWLIGAGCLGFSTVLIWRLWLNSRALGRAGPFPPARRFWRVYVPLGLLALTGLCLAGLGFGMAVVAATALRAAEPGAIPLAVGASVFLLTLGGMMCWPLMSRLLRKPSAPSSEA